MRHDSDSDRAPTASHDEEQDEQSSPPPSPPPPPARYQWKREHLIYTHHGFNLYVRPKVFEDIKDVLKAVGGKSAIQLFKGGTIGRLVDHHRRDSANVPMHHLLTRQLVGPNIPPYEAWFYVGGRILRFTGADYALITGLHFGYTDFDPHAQHQASRSSLFYTQFRCQPTKVSALHKRFLARNLGKNPIDYVKAANLLMYYMFLLCRGKQIFIENWAWALVENLEEWNWFPWGAYMYQTLLHYLNKIGSEDVSKVLNYHLCGPIWALQIWFYELIPAFGALCGIRDTIPRYPRCLMWETRQAQMDWTFFFDDPELEVLEALEPSPEELESVYYLSLSNGDMLCVPYVAPVRIAEKKEKQPQGKKKKGKRDVAHGKSVGAAPKKRRHNEESEPSLICCQHGDPCRDSEKDCSMDEIDRRLVRVLHDESEDGFMAKMTRKLLGGIDNMLRHQSSRSPLDYSVSHSPTRSHRRSVGAKASAHDEPQHTQQPPRDFSSAATTSESSQHEPRYHSEPQYHTQHTPNDSLMCPPSLVDPAQWSLIPYTRPEPRQPSPIPRPQFDEAAEDEEEEAESSLPPRRQVRPSAAYRPPYVQFTPLGFKS